ncbi:AraC family transcriptional regulator [Novosphingobium sp. PS1R-30]|uniref:AraC family transcriptional regulator n=1 Tax=Novosphingobium anseongense TaxID=3133436 RepID=A0ABU8S1M1_9SPHN
MKRGPTERIKVLQTSVWNSEAVIADALCNGPELEYRDGSGNLRFSRWRRFMGSYEVPALPAPMFVVQMGGKSDVRFWDRDGWSEATTFPGAATLIPAGHKTRWLVDGELDVITFSFGAEDRRDRAQAEFSTFQFAYCDPLAAALSEQILGEMCQGAATNDNDYLNSLTAMLSTHLLAGRNVAGRTRYPTSGFSSYRIHKVMNAITADPAKSHSLTELAELAGITESHLCRVFKEAMGTTVHAYLLKARLDRARQLLSRAELPMSHVAELSGFSGASQLARAFRQHLGETPSHYRARMF